MKISVDDRDQDRALINPTYVRVLLNDEPVEMVIMADSDAGVLRVYERDDQDRLMRVPGTDEAATRELRGRVRIELLRDGDGRWPHDPALELEVA